MLGCHNCGSPVQLSTKYLVYKAKKTGRVYCSSHCSSEYKAKVSSAVMAATNRRYASDRMKARNPMARIEARQKMAETLRSIGHKPPIRGGNGMGNTKHQDFILRSLAEYGAIAEYVQKTFKPRGSGYPPCYKIDVAIPSIKLAIEVDGLSHLSLKRMAQDDKKEQLLASLGWLVLRFTNRNLEEDFQGCFQMVMSTILKLKETITTSQTAS